MRRAALVPVVLAALAAAAPAGAAPKITVCGTDACQRVLLRGAPGVFSTTAVTDAVASTKTVAAPPPQPYFDLRVEGGPPHAWYAPKAQRLENAAGWVEVNEIVRSALEQATRSVEPFPTPKPTAARVNGRPSPTPAVYAGLLADLPQADAPPVDAPTAVVEVSYGSQGPWDDARLSYAPTENTVQRADGWFSVPDELAAQVESDLRREGVQGRRTWGSSIVFALVFTGALFVGWLTFYRRKWWKTGGRKRKVSAPEGEAPRSSPRR